MIFSESFKCVAKKCSVFQGRLKGVLGFSNFKGCVKYLLRKLQEFFKIVSKVLKRKLQKCSKEVSMFFEECLNNVLELFKSPSRKFQ